MGAGKNGDAGASGRIPVLQPLDTLADRARVLLTALTACHPDTALHCQRTARIAVRLGREMGLNNLQLHVLDLGALLHDIGKIGVPTALLDKTERPTEDEWRTLRAHVEIGAGVVRGLFPDTVGRCVAEHHERWDGEGYPRGKVGRDISIFARICAVADAYDVLTFGRAYRAGAPHAIAVHEINEWAGRQFDPMVVAAFLRIPRTELAH